MNSRLSRRLQRFLLLASALLVVFAACAPASGGTQPAAPAGAAPPKGTPVNLTVGYFPTWIGGWSGAIVKKKELWKKYLPEGSTVEWDVQLVGAPIVNAMLAGKEQIGYLGDTPAMIATTKRAQADIRIVQTNLFSSGQICSIMLVPPDAPDFATQEEALKWLAGKKIGVAGKGSCGDRFVTSLMARGLVAEPVYLGPETIRTNLQARKVDAAQQFEPHVSQIVGQGIAKIAFVGAPFKAQDASFMIMRKDFIDQNRAAAVGWLKADLEAQKLMLDKPDEVVDIMAGELEGWTKDQIRSALDGTFPKNAGATDTNAVLKFGFDDEVKSYIESSYKALADMKAIDSPTVPEGAYLPDLTEQAARELNVTLPIGSIKAKGKEKGK
jgi:NitT/TauT family transport system substrate-binding protein